MKFVTKFIIFSLSLFLSVGDDYYSLFFLKEKQSYQCQLAAKSVFLKKEKIKREKVTVDSKDAFVQMLKKALVFLKNEGIPVNRTSLYFAMGLDDMSFTYDVSKYEICLEDYEIFWLTKDTENQFLNKKEFLQMLQKVKTFLKNQKYKINHDKVFHSMGLTGPTFYKYLSEFKIDETTAFDLEKEIVLDTKDEFILSNKLKNKTKKVTFDSKDRFVEMLKRAIVFLKNEGIPMNRTSVRVAMGLSPGDVLHYVSNYKINLENYGIAQLKPKREKQFANKKEFLQMLQKAKTFLKKRKYKYKMDHQEFSHLMGLRSSTFYKYLSEFKIDETTAFDLEKEIVLDTKDEFILSSKLKNKTKKVTFKKVTFDSKDTFVQILERGIVFLKNERIPMNRTSVRVAMGLSPGDVLHYVSNYKINLENYGIAQLKPKREKQFANKKEFLQMLQKAKTFLKKRKYKYKMDHQEFSHLMGLRSSTFYKYLSEFKIDETTAFDLEKEIVLVDKNSIIQFDPIVDPYL